MHPLKSFRIFECVTLQLLWQEYKLSQGESSYQYNPAAPSSGCARFVRCGHDGKRAKTPGVGDPTFRMLCDPAHHNARARRASLDR